MPAYQVIILAVVQGVTEFLPISSTAHLALVPWVFGWRDPGLTFDIALHIGTLAAVALYFARTWIRVILLAFGRDVWPAPPSDPDRDLYQNPHLFWFLVAATIPAGVAGLALERYAETTWRSPFVIAFMMIAVGLLLWWAERAARLSKDLGRITLADSLVIGFAQALSVVPGTSRSGITIAAALFCGIARPAAARFSFLLSTPIIAGAALHAAFKMAQSGIAPDMRLPFALGVLISGLTGYAVIAFFLRFLQTGTLKFFIWYRMICGIMILALAIFFRDP